MEKKPTYEELESKVRDLEIELEKCRSIEDRLGDSKDIVNKFFNNSHDYMGIIEVLDDERDLRYIKLNEAAGKYLGKSPKALKGTLASQIGVTEEVRCQWIEKCRKSELTGAQAKFEYKRDLPDGAHTLLASVSMIKFPIFSFVITDITEIKKAETALRESEENFRTLVETMTDGLGLQDKDGLITYVNNKFCQMLGYKPDDFVGKAVSDFLDERNKRILKEQIPDRIKGKTKPYELIWDRKDGTKISTIMSPQAIFDEKKQFKGSFAVITDISDLKQAEGALRESEEKYRSLFQGATNPITIIDKEGIIIMVNDAGAKQLGRPQHECVGKSVFEEIPDLDDSYHKVYQQVIATGKEVTREDFVELPSGFRWFWSILQPVSDINGKRYGVQIISYDITDRKKAEEALRESEEKFRMIYANSSDGIIVADPETKDFLYVNPAICRILDYTEEELTQMGMVDIHPKDSLEHVASEFEAQARGEKLLAMDIPFLKKNEEKIYMDTNASIVTIGGKRRIMGVFRDITDRKKAEEALKKAHLELEQRVEERTKELKIKTKSLEELNTAMKVLLEKRTEDRIKLEDNVLANTKELIEPLIVNMKETNLNDHQKMILGIIESNLDEITSNFTRKLSLEYLNLTPTEMKIANLIKHGTTTKEIAEIMKSSPRTIETHRKNIREKVGLKQNRKNLRSYLLSLH